MPAARLGCGALLLALVLGGAAGPAHAQAGSKCGSLKLKAAGAYFKAQASCRAKSVAKGAALQRGVPRRRVATQLARALAKAAAEGRDCLTLEGDLPAGHDPEGRRATR